jgi:hypothetical protein
VMVDVRVFKDRELAEDRVDHFFDITAIRVAE